MIKQLHLHSQILKKEGKKSAAASIEKDFEHTDKTISD